MLASEKEIKKMLRKNNLAPNKLMGQHFLIDEEVLRQIVASARMTKQDVILEAGPGLGVLTRALAKKAKQVIAVEKDPVLTAVLQKQLAEEKINNVALIAKDILHFNPKEYGLRGGQYKIIANLPYYLSGKFLRKFLTESEKPKTMILLLQKEVAERIVAGPPGMSLLSLSVQLYAKPKIISEISKNSFYPKPKIESALIKISGISNDFFKKNKIEEQVFWNIAKAGFSQKRKTLLNNLSGALAMPKTELEQVLKSAEINPGARAESLSLKQWTKLATLL
ncbi:ribosomal RNA small subunit methyltransferase A [Patescibacteria group bacterium]|nr:ribosomal RNA small subunit methyltransferase A [Patescibacteria group bacterium]